VPRRQVGRYDDLLSVGDVERLVSSPGLRHPGFRLVKAGAKLDLSDYTEDIPWRPKPFTEAARVPRVLAEFDAGATVVLQGLHLSWEPLATFCRGLESTLGHPAQANAYYTPRRAQGLAVHHDTHDVFVLQIAGSKRWLVYEPALELPLKYQHYRSELGEPGDALLDVVLEPGDTLYLPRGWLHQALTSDEDSLHLTVGVNVYTWLDALHAAVDRCGGDIEFRRGVPADGIDGAGLVERLVERLEPDEVATAMRQRLVATRKPILGDQLAQLRALDRLSLDSELERRPTVIADLRVNGDDALLSYEGSTLALPARILPELEFLMTMDESFTPADLPGTLDADGRLVLVRRLVRDGFLRFTQARPR
jgi:hypothetical protein